MRPGGRDRRSSPRRGPARPGAVVRLVALVPVTATVSALPAVTTPLLVVADSGPRMTVVTAAQTHETGSVDRNADLVQPGDVLGQLDRLSLAPVPARRTPHRESVDGRPASGFHRRLERPPIPA